MGLPASQTHRDSQAACRARKGEGFPASSYPRKKGAQCPHPSTESDPGLRAEAPGRHSPEPNCITLAPNCSPPELPRTMPPKSQGVTDKNARPTTQEKCKWALGQTPLSTFFPKPPQGPGQQRSPPSFLPHTHPREPQESPQTLCCASPASGTSLGIQTP
ncbi:hypothetical protein P7K49_009555 [Saguinus oedipus]|uniref:Uncharacterized protein n=1 Tax=Saguinus oedipus TaxID=9490 RepID=A0ABQ9VLP5_SAGOE|nr:hypothetical protein P7K49_009555 [Saguinus oedipus]